MTSRARWPRCLCAALSTHNVWQEHMGTRSELVADLLWFTGLQHTPQPRSFPGAQILQLGGQGGVPREASITGVPAGPQRSVLKLSDTLP